MSSDTLETSVLHLRWWSINHNVFDVEFDGPEGHRGIQCLLFKTDSAYCQEVSRCYTDCKASFIDMNPESFLYNFRGSCHYHVPVFILSKSYSCALLLKIALIPSEQVLIKKTFP